MTTAAPSDYATADDLRRRLSPGVAQEIYGSDRAPAEDDLSSAGAEIDAALAARWRLPVEGPRSRALLRDWVLTLAEERAYARCVGDDWSQKIKARAAQVRACLERIRSDDFRLPDAEEVDSSASGPLTLVEQDAPVFGRERMNGY